MHSMFITKPLNILYSRFLVCCMQVSEQCCCCVYCCVYTAGPKLLYRQQRDWQWQKTVCHFWRMLPHKLFIMKESLCSISFNLTPRRAHEFVRTPMGGAVLFWKVEDRFHKLHKNFFYGKHTVAMSLNVKIDVSLLIISSCQSVTCLLRLMVIVLGGKIKNNYLLLPHAIMLYWVLIIIEQSTPHTTLWASNSTGKHTCCGELWVSWVPSPRRPFRQRNPTIKLCAEVLLS